MMHSDEVIFGWAAPPIKRQYPTLDAGDAEHFDKDNEAIIRCHLRGLITDSQRNAAFAKLAKKISQAIRAAQK